VLARPFSSHGARGVDSNIQKKRERTKQMNEPKEKCPKHGIPYSLRRNVKTGGVAIACPLCDIEANRGAEKNVRIAPVKIIDLTNEE
jgi:hypothetical protein